MKKSQKITAVLILFLGVVLIVNQVINNFEFVL